MPRFRIPDLGSGVMTLADVIEAKRVATRKRLLDQTLNPVAPPLHLARFLPAQHLQDIVYGYGSPALPVPPSDPLQKKRRAMPVRRRGPSMSAQRRNVRYTARPYVEQSEDAIREQRFLAKASPKVKKAIEKAKNDMKTDRFLAMYGPGFEGVLARALEILAEETEEYDTSLESDKSSTTY